MTSQYADLFAEVERDRETAAAIAETFAETDAERVGPDGSYGVMTRQDGFVEYHEVRATEAWRPSLVRLDERPRVGASRGVKPCTHCGEPFKGINRARYCSDACRQSAYRAR